MRSEDFLLTLWEDDQKRSHSSPMKKHSDPGFLPEGVDGQPVPWLTAQGLTPIGVESRLRR